MTSKRIFDPSRKDMLDNVQIRIACSYEYRVICMETYAVYGGGVIVTSGIVCKQGYMGHKVYVYGVTLGHPTLEAVYI